MARNVLVIGGGAAGLIAAAAAASAGANTVILERMRRPGRKLVITGKGRCNLTNIEPVEEFIQHFGANGPFLRQAFYRFFSDDLIDLLHANGVDTVQERGGRIFPISSRAQDVVDALQQWALGQGVEIRPLTRVKSLELEGERIACVAETRAGQISTFSSDAVIVATGGLSYPATGSSGDGYRWARQFGHTIVPTRPALVPLITAGDTAAQLQGLALRNVRARLLIDDQVLQEQFGEMLFTHDGVSGPIILTLSKHAVDALAKNRTLQLSIDLKPALDREKLDTRLLRDIDNSGRKSTANLLKQLLPRKMIPVCIHQTSLSPDKPGHQITAQDRLRLLNWLKNFRLDVVGHRSIDEAIVTAGGVSTKEINPKTMESRL
ncbi:MAG: NAD(P)/FAD-dependent oxidoreductase, partial [Chloroflexota bacterium]